MPYKINFEAYSNNFAIPQEIIDENFESLDPTFLKVILLIYKNADKNYSVNLLSNLLNVSEEKVDSAINYWISKNFLIQLDKKKIKPEAIVLSKISQTVTPINSKSLSQELSYLLECMESILSRPITSVEHKTVVHILEFLKLPADVVLMAIEYCVSIDKISARYIEKVCTSWADNGIRTHELAEQYLNLLKQSRLNEMKVQKIFGIESRNLIDSERNFINRWLNEFKFDVDVIKLAYEKTINAIGKLAFPYINKILLSWFEKGYKTLDDVQVNESPKKVEKKSTSYDIEELDRFWDNVPKLN